MMYGIDKYVPCNLFRKIEDILKRAPKFIREEEEASYYRARYKQFSEGLLNRFDLIAKQASFFLVEENYTEHTWKELHALHYANTNYSHSNKVMRVHFWNSDLIEKNRKVDDISQEDIRNGYLGYVTLRPVPDYNLMLSFIMPNWLVLKYDVEAWIMTYERRVHIVGGEVLIKTTPFYFQDTVFIRCAHADMLMFSLFLHHSYNFPRLSISDMIESNRYYPIPNGGLEYSDMLDIFYRNKIPVNFYYKPKRSVEKDFRIECIAVLNSYLESKLPVIVYNDQHVVLVIGHTNESEKRFIVYDDSGYFLSDKAESKNFVGIVKAEDLFPDTGETYMIAATYERVYLNPQEYFHFLDDYLSDYEKKEEDEFPSNFRQCRNIMVDNAILKGFLNKNCMELDNPDIGKQMKLLLETDQPHYLWYSEYTCEDYRYVLLADPTYPSATSETIFPYGGFFCKPEGEGISFLTKVKKRN